MSNRASLERTQFVGPGNSVGWGWRMCDDCFRSYADDWTERDVPTTSLELLDKACAEATEQERQFFANLLAEQKGISINGSWFDFDEIEPVLKAVLEEEA